MVMSSRINSVGSVGRSLGGAGTLGRAPGGQGFELQSNLVDIGQIGDLHTRGERSAAGVGDDEAIVFEALERLAHRSAADVEFAGHPDVVDGLTRPDLQRGELVPQGQVRTVGQGGRCGF
jgi:hypothetical protein